MHEQQDPRLNWGWISGTALGLGSMVGVAWSNWNMFVAVALLVAGTMIWWAERPRR